MSLYAERIENVPLLRHKYYESSSIFTPENLLRESRRQKALDTCCVPAVCVLDPDGDLVDYLQASGQARRSRTWACYHTTLDTFIQGDIEFGIVGRVVGAPFAVLVAEELFACGCQFLISITSAGQIISKGEPPYVVLIEQALRDEGTSFHYLPPSPFCYLASHLKEQVCSTWDYRRVPLYVGASWTTDAPFRETEEAIAACRDMGILAVEMEAAALYALASARQKDIICFAHVTNQMGLTEGDFEKGLAQGSITALRVLHQAASAWMPFASSPSSFHT